MSDDCKCLEETKAGCWWVTLSGQEWLEGVSYWVSTFREGISMEVTFESAAEWREGDNHVETWGGDSRCKSPEVGVNWCDWGRQRWNEGGRAWLRRSSWPWEGVDLRAGVGRVFSEAFPTICSLISLTALTSCVFKLHFNVYLGSDIQ